MLLWLMEDTNSIPTDIANGTSCASLFSFVHSIQVRIAGKWLTTFVTRKTSATMNDVGMIFQTILGIFCCTSHWSQEKVVCLYCLHSYKYFYWFANLCLNKFVLFVKMFSRIACRRNAFLIYEWVCGTLNDYYVWRTSHSFLIWVVLISVWISFLCFSRLFLILECFSQSEQEYGLSSVRHFQLLFSFWGFFALRG